MDTETRKYRLTFIEQLLGTCPDKDVYEKYITSKAPVPDDEETREELETVPEGENGRTVTRFHRDVDGIYLLDYQVKGFFKEAGNILKDELPNVKGKGIKALRSKIDNFLFIFPRYIPIADKADGEMARSIRAQTPQGPRICIGVSEYVDAGKSIEIKIDLFPHKEITWPVVEMLLDFGAYKGIGQFRNGSYGRFTWERVRTALGQSEPLPRHRPAMRCRGS